MATLQAIPLLNGDLSADSATLMSDAMELVVSRGKRTDAIANSLMKQHQGLNFITAYIMAGDIVSAEEVTKAVKAGKMTAIRGLAHIGSYARFDWAVSNLTWPQLRPKLLELWAGSDPDDTNLEYLELFRRRAASEKRKYASDKLLLPKGTRPMVVYRGQRQDEPRGFSWTLDRDIAVKFANGAGTRCPTPNGVVYETQVARQHVLAYITRRGEAELIVDVEKAGLV